MAMEDIAKNHSLFVDGKGYAGNIDEVNPPELASKLEEIRAGGMDAPVDVKMGLEKMTADFSLNSFSRDVLALFGVAQGQTVPFVAREALESFDGTVTAVEHVMRGRIAKMNQGTSKAGDKKVLKIDLTLSYYRLTHGGVVVHEIDPINMVHIVNGVDVLAAQRAALGI